MLYPLRLLGIGLFCIPIIISCNSRQSPFNKETKEVQDFLAKYERHLQKNQFDSIPALYADTGFISLGNGEMSVESMDSIKAFYSRLPKDIDHFRWANTRIDILEKNTALITSLFYVHSIGNNDTLKQCYTGVLQCSAGKWRIKHEHESLDF